MNIEELYKAGARQRKLTFNDIVLYKMWKAARSKKKNKTEIARALIYKSISPVFNEKKLSNGMYRWNAFTLWQFTQKQRAMYHRYKKEDVFLTTKWFGDIPIEHLVEPEIVEDMRAIYNDLVNRSTESLFDSFYSYIFVRNDLTPSQMVVQAAHAAMVGGVKFAKNKEPFKPSSDRVNFIVIGVDDLSEPKKRLNDLGIKSVTFKDQDIYPNDPETAIFTLPIHFTMRGGLTGYPLLDIPVVE